MTDLRATYRLQFREHLDFAAAAEILPYLARLGVSHVYASPLSRATPGSTHGYDAVDFNEIEPTIGGLAGFRSFQKAMEAAGLRLILDVVPNHMAASPLNPWWRDVLEWGAASRYAGHFDVDWNAPRLLVPVLGAPYGDAIENGELKLRYDAAAGAFALTYYDFQFPLTPPSYARILSRGKAVELKELARRFALAAPDTADELKASLRAATDSSLAMGIEAIVDELNKNTASVHELHEAQPWRLSHWRTSRESLTYRRFFEISDLVGVRVENPRVFDDVHRRILSLVAEGAIDGLRIDHVDGLAQPLDYLRRLQSAIGKSDYYVVVEKILGAGEELRTEWPIAGTTGYEFTRILAGLLVDSDKADALTRAYNDFIGSEPQYAELADALNRRTLTRNLAGELDVLASQAYRLAQGDVRSRDFGFDTLRRAIIELATALPVYRTYIDAAGPSSEDLRLLSEAAEKAKVTREVEDHGAIDFIVQLLSLSLPSAEAQAAALNFAVRLQQTTGPLMAKAVEDTLFYRYNRLIALNEVGGEPDQWGGGVAEFHAAMASRMRSQPLGLSATSTHDTKRGEDGRARIYAISEIPDVWADAVRRWSEMNAAHREESANSRIPETEMEWFFYQSLLGAVPTDLEGADNRVMATLTERLSALMQKAAREAKVHTSWTHPAENYEEKLARFVEGVLNPAASAEFLRDFMNVAEPLLLSGAVTSLTQLLIKLVAPGVPDIYQGTELWDLSLVDPDNRAAVDFPHRAQLIRDLKERAPTDLLMHWRSGAMKMRLMSAGLAVRRNLHGWKGAAYLPVFARGECERHVVSFARILEDGLVLAVGVRLPHALLSGQRVPLVPPERWERTRLELPVEFANARLYNAVTAESVVIPDGGIAIGDLLARFPVALLSTCAVGAQREA